MLDGLVSILLLWVAYVDHKTMKIPDKLNLMLGFCCLLSCIQNPNITLMERMFGFAIISVPMYLLCLFIPEAFGGGDIKLTAVMGFYLGWKRMLVGAYISFLIGGVQAVYILQINKSRKDRTTHMAFGPALCFGMWIAMLCGNDLISWYFGLWS